MFFDKIYGQSHQGFAAMMTRSESGRLDSERFFEWPVKSESFERIVRMRKDEDVYYSVALFSGKKRTQMDERAVTKIVWADADICEPDKFRAQPSIVVQTSPAHSDTESCGPRERTGKPCNGHFHVMWELDRFYPAQEVQDIARKISYAHKDEGCDLGWTMTKILRVPGTVNTKFEPPYVIPPPEYSNDLYSLEYLAELYGDIDDTSPTSSYMSDMPELLDVGSLEHFVEQAGATSLYLETPKPGQSWSERSYRLQLDLFRHGLTPQEVFTLVENAACNKYNPMFAGSLTQTGETIPNRADPHGTLWREVQKVHAEFKTEVIPTRGISTTPDVSLLSEEEYALVRDNPTILDRFSDWVFSRHPDVDKKYPRAMAWMALSCAYGNLTYVDSLYGKMFPNLWIMIGGQSTVGHKSAAKRRMLEVVHALEEQSLAQIDIGSDATAERLTSVLGERDKEVSLLHTDEINGFFRETMTKNYRSGTLERYTELYDGYVPVVLRATEGTGNTSRAQTVFNLAGVGIYNHIVRTLTRENFESGFLLRALWVIGEDKDYEQGDADFANNKDDIDYGDPMFLSIVKELVRGQSRYDMEDPLPLRLSDEALDRLNKWTHGLKKYCISKGDEVLMAGIDRLRDSVVKSAALLSYHNESEEIELFEMLVALAQGEEWFNDLDRILSDVSATSFGRVLDEIERYISLGSGRQRSEGMIYKKFGFKPYEFRDAMEALTAQGRARRIPRELKWEILE